MTAIDTTVSLSSTQLAGLRAAGVTCVSRYIAPQSWKRITPAEAGRYGPAGVELVLNWESGARDLVMLSVGTTESYARAAVQQAQACDYPPGCVIYGSADWDVQASEWATVAANLRAIRLIYRAAGYGLGLYAPWDALAWAQRDGLVDCFWQAGMSTAWSAGRNRNAWPGAHLRQRRGSTIAGVDCDLNDILIARFGQWSGAGAISPTSITGADMELDTTIPGSGYGAHPQTLDVRLALIDLTKALDPYDTNAWQNEQLRNSRAILAAVQKLTAPPAVDVDALAEKVAAALVASNANGLTPADHAAVVEDVKTALRSGTAQ